MFRVDGNKPVQGKRLSTQIRKSHWFLCLGPRWFSGLTWTQIPFIMPTQRFSMSSIGAFYSQSVLSEARLAIYTVLYLDLGEVLALNILMQGSVAWVKQLPDDHLGTFDFLSKRCASLSTRPIFAISTTCTPLHYYISWGRDVKGLRVPCQKTGSTFNLLSSQRNCHQGKSLPKVCTSSLPSPPPLHSQKYCWVDVLCLMDRGELISVSSGAWARKQYFFEIFIACFVQATITYIHTYIVAQYFFLNCTLHSAASSTCATNIKVKWR